MVELIGTCYEDAWRFLIKEEEGELIHGTVESLGRRIGHAWIELPTGFIWEPESRQFIKKADFQAMAKPQEEHRYTVDEAAIMLARVGKHGPWTEQERQMLKRGNPEFGEKIAKELNLRYDGIQEGIGMQFTDIHGTGTTFYATSMEDAREQLRKKRRLFGMAERGNPIPKAVVRYKRNYGAGKSVFFVEYEYGGERYITGTVVRGTDRSLGWYFGKGTEGLKEANRIALLSDEEFSKAEDLAKYSWEKIRETLSEPNPTPKAVSEVRELPPSRVRSIKEFEGLQSRVLNLDAVAPESTSNLLGDIANLPQRIKPLFNEMLGFLDEYAQLATQGKAYQDAKVDALFDKIKNVPVASIFDDKAFNARKAEALADPTRANKVLAIDAFVSVAHDRGSMLPLLLGKEIPRGAVGSAQEKRISDITSDVNDILDDLAKPPAVEEVKPGDNPMGKVITKEEAIGMLERLSATPQEAARLLVTDEAERRAIWKGVQERVKREQNKWAPMDPREGPPLPRIFAGLRWPWRKQ